VSEDGLSGKNNLLESREYCSTGGVSHTAATKSSAKGIGVQSMKKEENSPSTAVSEANSSGPNYSSTEEGIQRHWHGVKRRSFLNGLGIAGAAFQR
jgi:hypothetical protein